jgi:ribosomal protein S18 acetylase RimI-like enzyme
MSTSIARALSPTVRVVDLSSVAAPEIDRFLRYETALWRERLYWDVSAAVTSLRRALERGGIAGKAVRYDGALAAFAYYSVENGRGVVSGFLLAPEWASTAPGRAAAPLADEATRLEVARATLEALMTELRGRGVRRVETQFVGFDAPWLVPVFEAEGFQTHWRDFLRLPLASLRSNDVDPDVLTVLPWRAWNLSEATLVMCRAHEGGVDAAMNELYRTTDGCRLLLNNIVRQRGCGPQVVEASGVGRHRRTDRALGFALVTETARRQAHLAQLAVTPPAQRQGVGRALLSHASTRLRSLGFDTLSLMVSRGNTGALALYRSFGFEPVFRFPIFSREG